MGCVSSGSGVDVRKPLSDASYCAARRINLKGFGSHPIGRSGRHVAPGPVREVLYSEALSGRRDALFERVSVKPQAQRLARAGRNRPARNATVASRAGRAAATSPGVLMNPCVALGYTSASASVPSARSRSTYPHP